MKVMKAMKVMKEMLSVLLFVIFVGCEGPVEPTEPIVIEQPITSANYRPLGVYETIIIEDDRITPENLRNLYLQIGKAYLPIGNSSEFGVAVRKGEVTIIDQNRIILELKADAVVIVLSGEPQED